MANLFEQIRQAKEMASAAKALQKKMAAAIVKYENGGLSISAPCDLSGIQSISIDPELLKPENKEKFERLLRDNMSKLLRMVRDETQKIMREEQGGLGNLMGMFNK